MKPDTAPPDSQKFDYIVAGSGAGGGPLAARLAEKGWKVLVVEAGSDQSAEGGPAYEVTEVPALHAVASEHRDLSWGFRVKHYNSTEPVYYPRASALGGCTVHNAMITIAGPDSDWDSLGEFLDDESWHSDRMRYYFQKLERNEYSARPTPSPTSLRARVWDNLTWLFGHEVDRTSGRHGFKGWLRTSTIDLSIGLHDKRLVGVLKSAINQAWRTGMERTWTLIRTFLKGRTRASLDPNHARTQAESPEGLILIPVAVGGKAPSNGQASDGAALTRGRRSSPREFLLATQRKCPGKLVIETDCFVTEVLFHDGEPLRARGVRFRRGKKLYEAGVDGKLPPGEEEEREIKDTGEVILCGGAFNTPQLLMLSGIGDEEQLKRHGISCRVNLPGVGRNLQDRYEVTVVSEMDGDFSVLKDATFALPSDPARPDRHLAEWREKGTGLYTSNAGVLGILKRSKPDLTQPDLFIFGLPMSFKGYFKGYSAVGNLHNYFTWAILKSHTSNTGGTVELTSADPFDMPDINFHYFNESPPEGPDNNDPDLVAIVEGVKFVRGISKRRGVWLTGRNWIKQECFPGAAVSDDDQQLKNWIKRDAWGHHACGTCRMGPDGDPGAVLDSRFRVRGVSGLRVVDASIFPKIPGYYIVTNIYSASEKAADVIDEHARYGRPDEAVYPRDLRQLEADVIKERRRMALSEDASVTKPDETWADDVMGLGLSGGGIRSATFNLGILQSLARSGWLRRVDLLSTVSGGGYIGSFLGRCFDRLRQAPQTAGTPATLSAPSRVISNLIDPASQEISWLRRHGNYIAPAGQGDARVNAATFVRNLLSVHFVVGMLLFAAFGLANALRYGLLDPATGGFGLVLMNARGLPLHAMFEMFLGPFFSPWFLLFELLLLFLVVPRIVAYWIVSQDTHERFQLPGLSLLFVVVAALLAVAVLSLSAEPFLIAVSLCSSLIWVELAWRSGSRREQAVGRGSIETQRLRTRNILTYDLGLALVMAGLALAFAAIDAVGHGLQQLVAGNVTYSLAFTSFLTAIVALVPVARFLANLFTSDRKTGPPSTVARIVREQVLAGVLAIVFLTIPLVLYSFSSHAAYDGGSNLTAGLSATVLAIILSLILALPKAITFVNRSSISQSYAARLARAYLGASNPQRHRADGANITEVMAGDDVPAIRDYKPYAAGGPLHLINSTVNQTVDFTSQRGNRDRKGENVAVSSLAMSVGKCWHCAWEQVPDPAPGAPRRRPSSMRPLGYVPGTSHPLVDENGEPTRQAEMLSLRQWIGISGAAVGPGRGQTTQLGTALLFGLTNLRTGYWWDSGIRSASRDGFPELSFFRRFLHLVPRFFLTQSLLLHEWVARYPGPWEKYWYVSDGGFFENLGGYELIRRRIPRIILCDGSADPSYSLDGVAELIRKARIDFDADVEPLSANDLNDLVKNEFITQEVRSLLGTLDELKATFDAEGRMTEPSKKHATLLRVRYFDGSRSSIVLYIKASVTGDESVDIATYRTGHQEFPHESTADQFFDEAQWESYRQLGDHIGSPLLSGPTWLLNIPL